jgi:hypothetical protein
MASFGASRVRPVDMMTTDNDDPDNGNMSDNSESRTTCFTPQTLPLVCQWLLLALAAAVFVWAADHQECPGIHQDGQTAVWRGASAPLRAPTSGDGFGARYNPRRYRRTSSSRLLLIAQIVRGQNYHPGDHFCCHRN